MVTQRAQKILKSILRDIPKIGNVTTTDLLYRCQELTQILELDDKTKRWINHELMGYIPQVYGDDRVHERARIPLYRLISLPASVISSRKDSRETKGSHQFSIVFPCHSLETAVDTLTLSESPVVDIKPPMILTYTGEAPPHSLKGISAAIRANINLFAIQLSLATQVGSDMSGFFDNTLVRIAERIGALAPSTLDLLNDVVKKLKKSKSPEELRVILETLRTIMRRVTGVLMTIDMLKEKEEEPSESAISTKTTKILDWVVIQLDRKSKDEIKHYKKAVNRHHDQLRMLMYLINKPIHHKELQSVDKAQVERIMISVIVWIGDLVEILDKAGYIWKKEKSKENYST